MVNVVARALGGLPIEGCFRSLSCDASPLFRGLSLLSILKRSELCLLEFYSSSILFNLSSLNAISWLSSLDWALTLLVKLNPFWRRLCQSHQLQLSWIECDSKVIVDSFNQSITHPWSISYLLRECQALISSMASSPIVTHIHREGNHPADLLAANAHHHLSSKVYSTLASLPAVCQTACHKDVYGLPSYRVWSLFFFISLSWGKAGMSPPCIVC